MQSPHSNQYESSSDPTPRSHTKRKKSENKSNPSLKFIQNGMTEPVLSSRRKKQKIDTSSIAKKDNPINTEISNPGARALPLSSPDPEKYSKVSDCYSTQDLCKERGINKEMLATALTKHRLGLNFKTKTAFAKHLSVGRSLVSNAENTGLDDFPSRPSLEKFATGLNYESGIEFLNAIKKSQSAPQSQPDAPLNLNLSGNRTRNKTKVSDCYSTQDLCNERGINKEMLATALTKHRLDLNFKKKAAFADHLRVGRSLVSDAENTDLDDFPSRPSLEKFATGLNYESGIEFLNAIKKSQSAPQSQPDAPLNLNLSGNRTRNKTDDSKFGFSKKIFANFIIDRRKKLGFEGQSKFAKMVGIKKQTYNNIENSTMQRTFGSPDNQTKIADGLGYESLSTFFKAIKDSQSVTSQSQPETV
ncbi:MAG: helix-turn-helix transcriptional regulator [Chlamydiota bacterium]